MKKIIIHARQDINKENSETILNANAPYEWYPEKKSQKFKNGILLIHGLSDSPFSLKDMGKYFLSKGFVVRGLLLPGHGTIPGDLLKVKYREWMKTVEFGIQSFSGKVENLYIAGLSAGGTLGVYSALKKFPIKGLIMFAPAIQLKTKLGFMTDWHKLISWAFPRAKWLDIEEDKDYSKYESFTLNSADQINLLIKKLEKQIKNKPIDIPMFVVQSQNDMTIDANETINFFKKYPHPKSRLLLYTPTPQVKDSDHRIIKKSSCYPDLNIINMSHISLAVSPENPHYGIDGDYISCSHYLKDPKKFASCKNSVKRVYGETTKENINNNILCRLTFNPDFENMVKEIDKFIDNTE